MKRKILIVSIITVFTTLIILQACHELVTPGSPSCSFDNVGMTQFVKIELNWGDASNIAKWNTDHNTNGTGFTSDFGNIMDYNSNCAVNNAYITMTATGTDCVGELTCNYQPGNNGVDYSSNSLYNTPYSGSSFESTVILKIRSAEYPEAGNTGQKYVCYWEANYIGYKTVNAGVIQSAPLYGQWQPVSKSGDNGKPKRVYVNTDFNNYIYTL